MYKKNIPGFYVPLLTTKTKILIAPHLLNLLNTNIVRRVLLNLSIRRRSASKASQNLPLDDQGDRLVGIAEQVLSVQVPQVPGVVHLDLFHDVADSQAVLTRRTGIHLKREHITLVIIFMTAPLQHGYRLRRYVWFSV